MEPRSVRLNNTNRNTFVSTVLNTLLSQNSAPKFSDFTRKWSSHIYEYIYGPHKELIEQLPDWMKTKTEQITVFLGTRQVVFTLNKPEWALEDGQSSMYVGDDKPFTPICFLDDYDELTLEFKAHQQQQTDWNTKRIALKEELTKVVNACNTSSQLYIAWPKALEFSYLFPYKGSVKIPKPKISSAALDMTVYITKSTVGSPDQN